MIEEAVYYQYNHHDASARKGLSVKPFSRLKYDMKHENSATLRDNSSGSNTLSVEVCTCESLHLLYKSVSALMFPDLSDIMPGLVDDFVKPVWSGVSDSVSSFLSLLPGISPFPLVHTSVSWMPESTRGFLICRNVVGKWAAVDPEPLSKLDALNRQSPKLSKFIAAVNRFPSRGSGTICFDEGTAQAYFVESDFCSDQIYLYLYNSEQESLEAVCWMKSLPPGALHVYGVHKGRLIYSVGADIHIVTSIAEQSPEITIIESVLYHAPFPSLPVSTQHVAPFVSDAGDIYYLSRGRLWRQSCHSGSPAQCLFQGHICLSVSVNVSKKVIAIFGMDTRNKTYITLYDYLCGFVVSTSEISFGAAPLSVVSMSIDPVTLEVVLVGRSASARTGSLVRTFAATWESKFLHIAN